MRIWCNRHLLQAPISYFQFRDTKNGGPVHWIHENYVCKNNCLSPTSGLCCYKPEEHRRYSIEDTNFCKPDSPQGDNVLDHISQGNKISITAICKRNIKTNNRCLAVYDIVLTFQTMTLMGAAKNTDLSAGLTKWRCLVRSDYTLILK